MALMWAPSHYVGRDAAGDVCAEIIIGDDDRPRAIAAHGVGAQFRSVMQRYETLADARRVLEQFVSEAV